MKLADRTENMGFISPRGITTIDVVHGLLIKQSPKGPSGLEQMQAVLSGLSKAHNPNKDDDTTTNASRGE